MKPFNLKDALAGKAVKLRDGRKAHVRHHETELDVSADYKLLGQQLAWSDNRCYVSTTETSDRDIIGMYPEIRDINGFEVPLPEKEAPSYETEYYVPFPTSLYFYDERHWYDDTFDERVLERGLVFLNQEDAIATAEAMLGIYP